MTVFCDDCCKPLNPNDDSIYTEGGGALCKEHRKSHYYTLYSVGYTEQHFFIVYSRMTGSQVLQSATYDSLEEAETNAATVTAELDAQAARDEEAYLQSIREEIQ